MDIHNYIALDFYIHGYNNQYRLRWFYLLCEFIYLCAKNIMDRGLLAFELLAHQGVLVSYFAAGVVVEHHAYVALVSVALLLCVRTPPLFCRPLPALILFLQTPSCHRLFCLTPSCFALFSYLFLLWCLEEPAPSP